GISEIKETNRIFYSHPLYLSRFCKGGLRLLTMSTHPERLHKYAWQVRKTEIPQLGRGVSFSFFLFFFLSSGSSLFLYIFLFPLVLFSISVVFWIGIGNIFLLPNWCFTKCYILEEPILIDPLYFLSLNVIYI